MTTLDIAFILVPRFSMITLYSALEPLRVANRSLGAAAFTWRFVSPDGAAVAASNGIPVSVTGALRDIGRPNLAVVCASYDHEHAMTRPLLAGIRALARKGVWLGGVDTGAFLLAEAGVLDGFAATCHWETLPALREAYPEVQVSEALYVIDGARLTSSGGTVPLDMMLDWIGQLHGAPVAGEVADTLVHARHGGDPGAGRLPPATRYGIDEPRLLAAIGAMEQHVEDPLRIGDLAAVAGLSVRQFERLFRRLMGMAPMRFYQSLRLERAEHLLTYSRMSVRDVSLAAGFTSLALFSRSYKARYGAAPSRHRRRVQLTGLTPP